MMKEMDGKVFLIPSRVGISDFDVMMYEVLALFAT